MREVVIPLNAFWSHGLSQYKVCPFLYPRSPQFLLLSLPSPEIEPLNRGDGSGNEDGRSNRMILIGAGDRLCKNTA